MWCQAGGDPWRTTLRQPWPHVRTPPAPVLALWSGGLVLARSWARTAVRHWLAKGRPPQEPPVRHQRRAWAYEVPRQRGPPRQAVPVETCGPGLVGGVGRWGQGPPLALASAATALGTRGGVGVGSVVERGGAMPVAWVGLPATPPMPGGGGAGGRRSPATGRASGWRSGAGLRRGCGGGSSRGAGRRLGAASRGALCGLLRCAAGAPCRALCPSQGPGGVAGAPPGSTRGGHGRGPCGPCGRAARRPPGGGGRRCRRRPGRRPGRSGGRGAHRALQGPSGLGGRGPARGGALPTALPGGGGPGRVPRGGGAGWAGPPPRRARCAPGWT
jgi:hypothetical protein